MGSQFARFRRARYLKGAHNLSELPADQGAEVAFAGRSNAGKSSAINAITGVRNLARTSKTPGRTQLINFFGLDEGVRLVDLPGYGYAKVPEAVKRHWEHALERYLVSRRSLQGLVVMMDIRHPLTDYDLAMLDWCREAALPAHVLLTKADKLKRGPSAATLHKVRSTLSRRHQTFSVQLFSALKRAGIEEAQGVINSWLEEAISRDVSAARGQKKAPV
jgi:GTP-binding protein